VPTVGQGQEHGRTWWGSTPPSSPPYGAVGQAGAAAAEAAALGMRFRAAGALGGTPLQGLRPRGFTLRLAAACAVVASPPSGRGACLPAGLGPGARPLPSRAWNSTGTWALGPTGAGRVAGVTCRCGLRV
jgi:hypothetical protein